MASSSKKPAPPPNVSLIASRIDLTLSSNPTQGSGKEADDVSMPDDDRKNITVENVIPLKVALPKRYLGNRSELETFLL
jgi:hypothetical protein